MLNERKLILILLILLHLMNQTKGLNPPGVKTNQFYTMKDYYGSRDKGKKYFYGF